MKDMKDTIIRIGVASLLASNLMLGLTGCIRVSPLHCHSFADIDRFLEITAAIAAEKS